MGKESREREGGGRRKEGRGGKGRGGRKEGGVKTKDPHEKLGGGDGKRYELP